MHSGERQAAKMRMAYLKSMLNQDISLFDTEASTGEVIAAITSDIVVVQDAISEKVCLSSIFSKNPIFHFHHIPSNISLLRLLFVISSSMIE